MIRSTTSKRRASWLKTFPANLYPIQTNARERTNVLQTSGANTVRDRVCSQWVIILRSWPVSQIESLIPLSDEQRAELHDLTAAIYRATAGLVSACPAEDNLTALGRLDAK